MTEVDTARHVKERHEERLMSLPGVQAVAVGVGPTGREDDPAIIVFLSPSASAQDLPRELDGVPVVLQRVEASRATVE